jgi:hypothetical protein
MQRTIRHRILRTVEDGALTASGNSPTWDLAEISEKMPSEHIGADWLGLFVRITAVSGTSPTMSVALEISEDGTNWQALAASFTGLNAAGINSTRVTAAYPARFLRLSYTLGGTTPSFTFEARVKAVI